MTKPKSRTREAYLQICAENATKNTHRFNLTDLPNQPLNLGYVEKIPYWVSIVLCCTMYYVPILSSKGDIFCRICQ